MNCVDNHSHSPLPCSRDKAAIPAARLEKERGEALGRAGKDGGFLNISREASVRRGNPQPGSSPPGDTHVPSASPGKAPVESIRLARAEGPRRAVQPASKSCAVGVRGPVFASLMLRAPSPPGCDSVCGGTLTTPGASLEMQTFSGSGVDPAKPCPRPLRQSCESLRVVVRGPRPTPGCLSVSPSGRWAGSCAPGRLDAWIEALQPATNQKGPWALSLPTPPGPYHPLPLPQPQKGSWAGQSPSVCLLQTGPELAGWERLRTHSAPNPAREGGWQRQSR